MPVPEVKSKIRKSPVTSEKNLTPSVMKGANQDTMRDTAENNTQTQPSESSLSPEKNLVPTAEYNTQTQPSESALSPEKSLVPTAEDNTQTQPSESSLSPEKSLVPTAEDNTQTQPSESSLSPKKSLVLDATVGAAQVTMRNATEDKIQAQIHELQTYNERKDNEMREIIRKVEILEEDSRQLKTLKDRIMTLEKEVTALQRYNHMKDEELHKAREEIRYLKDELDKSTGESKELNYENENLKEKLKKMELALDSIKITHKAANKQNRTHEPLERPNTCMF